MDIEEKREKIAHLHNFFLKSFWFSFILLLLATWLCIATHSLQVAFINKYFPMNVSTYNEVLVIIIGIWKIMIVQLTLIPTLVLWSIKKHCLKGNCKV